MSRADGVQGAIRGVVGACAPAPAETQLEMPGDLFAPPMQRRQGEGEAAFAARQARALEAVRRGPGRPPGARNVSTREWQEWALRQSGGKHPLVELMRWMAAGPEALAEHLGCTLAEAFDRWRGLSVDLLPYFVARQAPVDDSGKAVPAIVLQVGGANVNTDPAGAVPWARAFRTIDGETLIIEQDQVLAANAGAAGAGDPHGDTPHGGK